MNNFRITDPTYLRTIHDGLLSGAVHKDNAAALPIGLVGMYEEALPPATNANERKKFLEFFSIWALLKKEVSVEFVFPLLRGWTEEQVIEYIAQYSKWFNSPTGGTYVLYHERLRAFVLQKISDAQFKACYEAIIRQCLVALEVKAGDEWESYALDHLSSHLLIQAMESKDATTLKEFAYDTAHWKRQVEISKGFEWSKRMLNDMMLWASKYDDDEVIECALNKVDLHHQEQNDAPRIVELVVQNDMETALQRIEAFGGNDKEGLQRKFILYMLCLMELTLLDSKDKPFRKEAVERLLKHLDESKYLNSICWSNYFPPHVVFEMAVEWHAMGVDYIKVYSIRTQWDWEISVFQDACLSKNVHIMKKLFPLIYAGARDNDRDWLYGCAAHLLGTDWVNNTLNERFFNDEALIRYYLSCGMMIELENHLNEIRDNERLLSASLVTAELMVLKGESTIDNYLFDIGELIDYFLDADEELYYHSLKNILYRYMLLILNPSSSYPVEIAEQYFNEYVILNDGNFPSWEAFLQQLETKSIEFHQADFRRDGYSKTLADYQMSLGPLQFDFLDLIRYNGISGDEEYPFFSTFAQAFKAKCREEYNKKKQLGTDDGKIVLLNDEDNKAADQNIEWNEILERYSDNFPGIDWEMQWSSLLGIGSSKARIVFLESLYDTSKDIDLFGFMNVQMRYYKSTKGPSLRKLLYSRMLDVMSNPRFMEELDEEQSKYSGFLKLVAFLFKENAVVNQNSFSDYERVFSQLRDISFSVIIQNIRENQKIATDFIELFHEVLLDIFDDGNYARILQFMDEDLAWLYQVNKKFLAETIIKLAESFEHYSVSFIRHIEAEEVYRYYYAAALIELRRNDLSEYERCLQLSLQQIDATGYLRINRELAQDLNSFCYSAVEDNDSRKIISYFNFPFQNNDLRKLFKASIIKYTGFSINYDVLLNFAQWQQIAPRDLERVLLCYYASRLLNENAEDILTECGTTLNIQWAIDIKNSFSAD